jgi:hypothetical protein
MKHFFADFVSLFWRLGEDACHGTRCDDACTGLRPCQQLLYQHYS